MALADIIAKIEADAESESKRILDVARERAESVIGEANAAADVFRREGISRAEADARREADRIIVSARLAARDDALAKRRALVDDVTKAVAESLAAAPDAEYAGFLARHIAAVARGGETLSLGAADAGRAEAVVEALRVLAPGLTLHVAGTPAPFDRGALVAGNRVRADLSLNAIVAERRDELELAIAAELFGREA